MEEKSMVFDGIEYKLSDLSEEQMKLVYMLHDLNEKTGKLNLEFEQLQVAKEVFIGRMRESLKDFKVE
jgi:hypothetical protein